MNAPLAASPRPRPFVLSTLLISSILVVTSTTAALAQSGSSPGASEASPPASEAPPGAASAVPPPTAWARADLPFMESGVVLWDVIAGGPGFIAVGGGFPPDSTRSRSVVLLSEDGRSWQSAQLFGEAAFGVMRAIAATPEGFVVVGSGCCPDAAAVWLSPDGVSWERLPDQPAFEAAAMLGLGAGPDGLLAVGCAAVMECGGGLAWVSADGRTWDDPVSLEILPFDVAHTTMGWLALGVSEPYGGSAALARSQDGSTWDATVLDDGGSLEAAVEGAYGILAAGGSTGLDGGRNEALLATSPDGVTWEPVTSRRLRGMWFEDVVARDDGLLLVGSEDRGEGRVPATLWATDLRSFEPGSFPREVKAGGVLHAAAFAESGERAVTVGTTVLNRGEVATAWVSRDAQAGR